MHFGFALNSWNINLWDTDLLDADLDLLEGQDRYRYPKKYFVYRQDVLQISLEGVLEDEKFLQWRRLEDVLKTCLADVLKNTSSRKFCGVLIFVIK